jgi:hypothetical protein
MSKAYTQAEIEARSKKIMDGVRSAGPEIYQEAKRKETTVTEILNGFDSEHRSSEDTMDGFEIAMAGAGIRTKSDHKRRIFADKVERFYASNQPESQILFPEYLNRNLRENKLADNWLNRIIAVRTPIDSGVYDSTYMDTSKVKDFRKVRVAERAEFPVVTMKTKEHALRLHKYGISMEITYEAVRRMRIDLLSKHLQRLSLQDQLDKRAHAIDILVNGDGNNNGATAYTTGDFDATATSAITYKSWLGWLMAPYPYTIDTIMGSSEMVLAVLTMTFPNMNPLQLLALMNQTGGVQANLELEPGVFRNVMIMLAPDAPEDTLIGIDSGNALEEIVEIGSEITETDKIISSQFNKIVTSENSAFGILYPEAIQTLTIGSAQS